MISGKTKLLGIIGNPIEHSFSPFLHNDLALQTNTDVIYVPFKAAGDMQKVTDGLRTLSVKGVNVTVPYKSKIMSYLDEVTEMASFIGAVNTVKNENGKLIGYNTDYVGFYQSLKRNQVEIEGKKVLVAGAGGAARAVVFALVKYGAGEITIANRTISKANSLKEEVFKKTGKHIGVIEFSNALNGAYDIIINTTTLGMHPDVNAAVFPKFEEFDRYDAFIDLVYNPLDTASIKIAKSKEKKTINGIDMLFYQGISAFEIWNDIKISDEAMSRAYENFKDKVYK